MRNVTDLVDLLRMGRLPQAWIAPPPTRGLRELVRHRAKLVALRSGLKASVHAVLAKQGVHLPVADLFGVRGRTLLEQAPLDGRYRARVNSLCRVIETLTFEIDRAAHLVGARLATDPGYRAIQALPGVGPPWQRSSWPRSGMSTASPAHVTCVRGPGSRHGIANPTPPCVAARSPSMARPWCAEQRWKPRRNPRRAKLAGASPRGDHCPSRPQHRHRRHRPQTAITVRSTPSTRRHTLVVRTPLQS
ncbi:MAG: hypothetical protein ACRDSL_22390 [Pseudonocardiaceae bacterium]